MANRAIEVICIDSDSDDNESIPCKDYIADDVDPIEAVKEAERQWALLHPTSSSISNYNSMLISSVRSGNNRKIKRKRLAHRSEASNDSLVSSRKGAGLKSDGNFYQQSASYSKFMESNWKRKQGSTFVQTAKMMAPNVRQQAPYDDAATPHNFPPSTFPWQSRYQKSINTTVPINSLDAASHTASHFISQFSGATANFTSFASRNIQLAALSSNSMMNLVKQHTMPGYEHHENTVSGRFQSQLHTSSAAIPNTDHDLHTLVAHNGGENDNSTNSLLDSNHHSQNFIEQGPGASQECTDLWLDLYLWLDAKHPDTNEWYESLIKDIRRQEREVFIEIPVFGKTHFWLNVDEVDRFDHLHQRSVKESEEARNERSKRETEQYAELVELIVTSFKQEPVMHAAEFANRYFGFDDDVIVIPSVPLFDPISRCLMTIPARSMYCSHAQAFDLQLFLKLSLGKDRYKCCKCNAQISALDIQIDTFLLQQIMKNNRDNRPITSELIRQLLTSDIEPKCEEKYVRFIHHSSANNAIGSISAEIIGDSEGRSHEIIDLTKQITDNSIDSLESCIIIKSEKLNQKAKQLQTLYQSASYLSSESLNTSNGYLGCMASVESNGYQNSDQNMSSTITAKVSQGRKHRSQKIDLDTCTQTDLTCLNGIGLQTAKKIIAARDSHKKINPGQSYSLNVALNDVELDQDARMRLRVTFMNYPNRFS